MILPEQNIPDEKKNRDWFIHHGRSIYMAASIMQTEKQRDLLCWQLFNGIVNEQDFDYLRKVDNFEYPAKIRHIPILRSRFQRLRALETRRFFKPRVFTVNKAAIQAKIDLKSKAIVDAIMSAYISRSNQLQQIQSQLDQQVQNMQSDQQNPEAAYRIQQMQLQIQQLQQPLQREEILNKKEIEKIEKYYNLTYKDIYEIYANSGLEAYMQKYNLIQIFVDGITEKIVTDQPIYCVELVEGKPDPVFRKVNTMNFYHSKMGLSKKIEDCDWIREDRYMSIPEITDEFRDELSPTLINQIKMPNFFGFGNTVYNTPYFNTSGYTDTNQVNALYSGTQDNSKRIQVSRCVWKAVRRLNFVKKPNKYLPGRTYLHFVPESELEDNDDIELRYRTEWYEITLIGGRIPLRMKRIKTSYSEDNLSVSSGPYIGRNWDGLTERPYSLVWATKDIQILYNILNYHMELWMALSGVKGMVMDRSQKPDGMTDAEWRYQRKLGTAWIQTVREGIQRNATFNQFQQFDDSIGNSIQYLQKFMEYLENTASTIIGVFHPQLGQIESTDQVGTYQQSNQMSSMVTEILYWEHDQIKLRALSQLVNLFKMSWAEGKLMDYASDGLGQAILSIPKGGLDGADFITRVNNGAEEEERIKELRQGALSAYQKGELRLNQWIKLYSSKTVKEMESMLDQFADEAMKIMENQSASESQRQQQIMEFQEKLKQQAIQMQGQIDTNLLQMKNQLESMKLELQKTISDNTIASAEKMNTEDNQVKILDIQSNRDTELAYLQEQRDEAKKDFVLGTMQVMADKEKADKDAQVKMSTKKASNKI